MVQVRNHLNYRWCISFIMGSWNLGADSSGLLHGYQRVRIILTRNYIQSSSSSLGSCHQIVSASTDPKSKIHYLWVWKYHNVPNGPSLPCINQLMCPRMTEASQALCDY